MPTKQSAGMLAYKKEQGIIRFLLVHPGGPFFKNKDAGAWSIPKGEFIDEEALTAAIREFKEELGIRLNGPFTPLTPITQKAGKTVHAFATAENIDITNFISNTFTIEWPPHSGHQKTFPEIDKAEWFTLETAKEKINPAQLALLEELIRLL